MKKGINGVIAIVLIGILGWNTYSRYQLERPMNEQASIVEIDTYSNEEDADESYTLLLKEEVKNEEGAIRQKDLERYIENTPTYIMGGSATLCYSSRDKVKD